MKSSDDSPPEKSAKVGIINILRWRWWQIQLQCTGMLLMSYWHSRRCSCCSMRITQQRLDTRVLTFFDVIDVPAFVFTISSWIIWLVALRIMSALCDPGCSSVNEGTCRTRSCCVAFFFKHQWDCKLWWIVSIKPALRIPFNTCSSQSR